MSHSNQPPGLPEIIDEAGDTPNWVPLVGLALVVAVALLIAVRQAVGGGEPEQAVAADTADAGSGEAQAGNADEKAPAAPKAAVGEPSE